MYIYESCTGSLFVTEEALSYEESYCETCGDTASFIGVVNNKKEAYKLLKADDWNIDYINEFINENFSK